MQATTKARRKAGAIAIEGGTLTMRASARFRKRRRITVPGSATVNCTGAISSSRSREDMRLRIPARFVTIQRIATIEMTGTTIGTAIATTTGKAVAAIGIAMAAMADLTSCARLP